MKNFHIHCATQCKIAAPTDKNCGNESKNHTTRGEKEKPFFFIQDPLYHFRFRNRNNYINAKKCSRNILDIFVVMCENNF